MRLKKTLLATLLIGAFLLQACGAAAAPEAAPEIADEAAPAVALVSNEDAPARARESKSVEAASVPAVENAGSNLGDGPIVTVSDATNCRSGPGVAYDKTGLLEAGQSAEVVAYYPSGTYVVVSNPNGFGTCWLWLEYADRSDFSSFDLPEAVAPPLPVEASPLPFEWSGYWTAWAEENAYVFYIYIQDDHFTGELVDNTGEHIIFNGTLDGSGRTVQGSYYWDGESGDFKLQAKGTNGDYFVGHRGPGIMAFCGAREAQPQPSPCLGP